METPSKDLKALLAFGLSDRLAKSLHVAGITNAEMAETLDVSANTVSNYINGNTKPRKLYLREWAVRTGVPLEWLETGQFPDTPETEKAPTPKGEGNGATYRDRSGDLFITSETLAPIIPISAAA